MKIKLNEFVTDSLLIAIDTFKKILICKICFLTREQQVARTANCSVFFTSSIVFFKNYGQSKINQLCTRNNSKT